jgi:metal-responsive CopG/Arc/MetJ family transcriptional regulator
MPEVMMPKPARKVRTTVALSEDLLEAMDAIVRLGGAESRNDFLETALRNQLAAARRIPAVDQDLRVQLTTTR